MITAKFGGTAITPRNLVYVKQCLSPAHKCVVVSAIGREHACDAKTTDLLKQYFVTRDERLWNAVADKYRRLVEVNSVNIDVEQILFSARSRAAAYNLDYCMSLGEELSAKVVASYLNAAYVEAEQAVRFGVRSLLYKATVSNLASALKGVQLAVTGGFYGGTVNGRRTFTRGGSDVTGSLCAAATESSLYENWTDSYGVCVANPAKVFDVATVAELSYDEMYALARAGAEVLHPDAVAPCQSLAIPIRIANYYNPFGPSTLVSNCPSSRAILSIAEHFGEDGSVVTTVLHSLPQSEITRLIAGYFADNNVCNTAFGKPYSTERIAALNLTSRRGMLTITTNASVMNALYKYFKRSRVI